MAACPDEANEFFNYVSSCAAGSLDRGGDLQIMFGVGGERDLTERELPHLEGWRHSAPVRVGNGAWNQRQLDVYGELLGAVYRLSDHVFDKDSRQVGPMADPGKWGAPPKLTDASRRFFVELADTAARRWQEKDQGIWEIRGEPREFLYSKLMCWVALDRAVALADPLNASDKVEGWTQTQAKIREAILTKGWSDRAGAFTQSFGSDELDASNLMLPLVGFLPADEPRVLSTIDATEKRLTDRRGLVYRYRSKTAWGARREPSFCAPSGWPKPWPGRDRWRGPAPSSNGPRPSSTTSGCCPRKSIPTTESSWAIFPRPSVTSDLSMRRGPFLKPNAFRRHLLRRLLGRRVSRAELRLGGSRARGSNQSPGDRLS